MTSDLASDDKGPSGVQFSNYQVHLVSRHSPPVPVHPFPPSCLWHLTNANGMPNVFLSQSVGCGRILPLLLPCP